VETMDDLRLDEFCDAPPAPMLVHREGDVVHYLLDGDEFGPHSAVDLVYAEVNLNEIPRFVPRDSHRKGYVFAEINTPARRLLFDVLVHDDVYPATAPELVIYDTSFDGVASANDRSRDIDRFDLAETIQTLGKGTSLLRTSAVPKYVDLLQHIFSSMNWNQSAFRTYRCDIEYPIYGSQVVVMFDAPEKV